MNSAYTTYISTIDSAEGVIVLFKDGVPLRKRLLGVSWVVFYNFNYKK